MSLLCVMERHLQTYETNPWRGNHKPPGHGFFVTRSLSTSNAGSPSDIPNRVPTDFAIEQRAIF